MRTHLSLSAVSRRSLGCITLSGIASVVFACSPAVDEGTPVVMGAAGPVGAMPTTPVAATSAAPMSTLPSVAIQTGATTPAAPTSTNAGTTTTGSTPPATGGTTATPAAPTPTTGGAATTTPPAATDTTPPKAGTGSDLTPNGSGWVSGTSNGVGVEGSFYELKDKKGATATKAFEAGKACVKGLTVAKVDDMDYDTWGAGMGFNFLNEKVWDGSKYKGVEFTADATSKNTMIVQFAMSGIKDGEEHFVALKSGKNTITWASLKQPDWVTTATSFSAAKILSMKIMIQADVKLAGDYSVCVTGMKITE